jgi:hypothetical protein
MDDESPEFTQAENIARLIDLRQQHADVGAAVEALAQMPVPDLMTIARLKKQKLALKDEITRLEDLATPDIIA